MQCAAMHDNGDKPLEHKYVLHATTTTTRQPAVCELMSIIPVSPVGYLDAAVLLMITP